MFRTSLIAVSIATAAYAAVCGVTGGTSDDSAAIKAALASCNNGGTVVLDKTYTIGSLLQTTDLSNVAIELTGTINLSADINYWSQNGFQLNYQNAYTAWTIGGSNIHIYGGGTYSGSGDTWYKVSQPCGRKDQGIDADRSISGRQDRPNSMGDLQRSARSG